MMRITVNVPVELYDLLDAEARTEFRSLSQQVVKILNDHYTKKKPATRQSDHFTDVGTYRG